MAQLKDTTISGSLRATNTIYTSTLQTQILSAPNASNSTTYGVGTNGQVLSSNGSSCFWGDLPTASSSVLGIARFGAGLSVQSGNVILDVATYNGLGGLKPAYTTTGAVTLSTAASANSSTPTIQSKTTTSGRYYAVEADMNGVLFVNVPWEAVTAVTHTAAPTTKYYITGTTSNTTNTDAEDKFDVDVYVTATQGEMSAKRYSYHYGASEKAYSYYNSGTNSIDFVFLE